VLRPYLLVLCCVCLLVTGQSLWKHALGSGESRFQVGRGAVSALLRLATNGYILAGVGTYLLATVLWFEVLSTLELSQAFPLMSLSYVLALAVGHLFFGEGLGWEKVSGVVLICAGVTLVGRG